MGEKRGRRKGREGQRGIGGRERESGRRWREEETKGWERGWREGGRD